MHRAVIPLLFLLAAVQLKSMAVSAEEFSDEDVEACKKEANYEGNFNETTPELKCFVACTMKRVGVMDGKTGAFDVAKMKQVWEEESKSGSEEGKKEYQEHIGHAVSCAELNNEVLPKSDVCAAAMDFVMCMVTKATLTMLRR